MTTSSSDLALTVPATDRDAEKEAFVHGWLGGVQALVRPLILELSVRISRGAALLEASSNDPAHCSEDVAALAWIQQSLEDIEATLTGLFAIQHGPRAGFQGREPFSAGNPES
ncbi:hypothetical protein [Paenarthrobacter aurescens]|jgi:hypothetical protein|nr:hypothetical protein [Paenarthrobacter aurescens]